MSVSIIIPTRNQHRVLDRAIKSIADSAAHGIDGLEIIIVNNQSDDLDSKQYLSDLPQLAMSWGINTLQVMDFDQPFNYSAINNAAVKRSTGDVLCFLNNDVEIITPDWLQQMITETTKDDTGCAGALLHYTNDTVQHAGVVLGMGTIAGHAYVGLTRAQVEDHPYFQTRRLCTAVTGACLAIQRAQFDAIGGFDEALAVAFNDVDLCLKARRSGFKNVLLPSVELYHHESLSRGRGVKTSEAKASHQREIQFMTDKWGDQVRHDPYWRVISRSCRISQHDHTHAFKRWWRGAKTVSYRHTDFINDR